MFNKINNEDLQHWLKLNTSLPNPPSLVMIIYLSIWSVIVDAVELRIRAPKWVTSQLKKKYISSSASTLKVKCMQMRKEDLELSLNSIKSLVKTI